MNETATNLLAETTATARPAADGTLVPARRRLQIASICTLFPTASEPHKGIFVARRVSHLAQIADVKALQPLPWFPFLRPQRDFGYRGDDNTLSLCRRRMFYLPGAFKRLDGQWLSRSIYPVLKRWRDESQLDLIDAHFGYPEGVGAVIAASRLRIPVFVTLRGNEQVYLHQPAIRTQLIEALQACNGIIAVSQKLCDAMAAAGIDARRIRVIPNAVDRTQFFPGDQCAARASLGLPLDSPVIVSVGQLVAGKGHHVLIRAVEQLRRLHPDVVLAIVGASAYERDYPRQLQALIESLELKATVRLVGAQPPRAIGQWLRTADVFALCTQREGCCNAVLEALASGLPVVTTVAGDNEVYVAPPRNGYMVPPDDPGAVSAALDTALGKTWDPQEISGRLPQAGWDGVARAVLDYFHAQLPGVSDCPLAVQG